MKNKFKRCILLAAASSILATFSASAANTFYAPGDLVLFFQQEGGTNTVYANLGAATSFRGTAAGSADGVNQINFLNLNSTLTSAFGAGWASDPTVYAGLAGVFSNSSLSNTVTNGDAARTLYVSKSRNGIGTLGESNSTAWVINTDSAMTGIATGIQTQNNIFENNYDVDMTVSPTSTSGIDEQNPFAAPGLQGNGFGNLAGGVQQAGSAGTLGSFGDAGNVEFALDLYRITAKTAVGQVPGVVRQGSYEGTVTLGSNGMVSFTAVPEPSSLTLLGLAAGSLALRRRRKA